jgi:hypothetical protein
MPMITHLDEVLCMVQAIQHCTNRPADHPMRFQRNLSWFEYVAQMAESMAAEWMVARTLGYDYSPGITWDKSKPMWATTSRSNGHRTRMAIYGFRIQIDMIEILPCLSQASNPT